MNITMPKIVSKIVSNLIDPLENNAIFSEKQSKKRKEKCAYISPSLSGLSEHKYT